MDNSANSTTVAERTTVGKEVRWSDLECKLERGTIVGKITFDDGTIVLEIDAITGWYAGKRIQLPYSCILGAYWDEYTGAYIFM
jgi:hypothetical protein